MNNQSIIFIMCGRKHSGKTHYIKQMLKTTFEAYPKLINDVNNEYNTGEPPPADIFIKTAKNIKNGVIVYEEATSMFGYQRDQTTAEVLTRSRHNGTVAFFCFHSVADIPRYIARNADFLILFKTGDDIEDIKTKFGRGEEKLIQAFLELKRAEWINAGTDEKGRAIYYSPHKVIEL